ncbi:MAG: PAS domain S-box protein [Deltaproteobacteria bacterium]|nr:PAS domain S-box protein [Deltaproteobacteria bacterium]
MKDKLNKKGRKPSQLTTLQGHFDGDAGFLTSIFINSPIGIYVVQNGKFCFANPKLQEITGYKEDELLGMESLSLVFTEDWSKVRENAIKMLKLKSHTPYEYRALNKEGAIKWAIETVTSIQYEAKPATLGYFMDITRRKQAEESLEKAYEDLQYEMEERKRLEKALMQEEKLKTLGAIAAEVAHEIRNPLVSIGGFAQRLKQKFPDLSECDIILSEAQRLEKILSRIRDYLEPVEIHPKECSLNTIISDCLDLLSPEVETRQVKCVSDLASRLPSAYVDPEILSQICIHLIRNATEAMAEGGELFIKSFENDREILIEFNNKATGLKARHPETLFMPFAESGQSFGLPLCYRLLKDMGGLLYYTQDDDCITVTVSLPKIVEPRSEKKEL